jgi:hypothetical protein
MQPQINQHITIVFNNQIQLEGILYSWNNDEIILKSLAGTNTIVILNVDEILFYKVNEATEQYKHIVEKPIKDITDLKKIAELKIELNRIEKEEAREKLSSHITTNTSKVNYGTPFNAFKIESLAEHTTKETPRQDIKPYNALQRMFAKKH